MTYATDKNLTMVDSNFRHNFITASFLCLKLFEVY